MRTQLPFFTILLSLLFIPIKAQFDLNSYAYAWDLTGFIYFHPNTVEPGEPYDIYQSMTNDELHQLVLVKEEFEETLEMRHYRYQETFRNLRVEGAEYTEHEKNGYLVFANGKLAQFDPEMNGEPLISEEEALYNVLEQFPGDHEFAWENEDWEEDLQNDLEDPGATYYPSGELLWALEDYKDLEWLIPTSKYRLAYRFDLLCLDPSFHKAFYVDALTGAIFREEQLRHENGPASIWYHGTQTIDTRWKGGIGSGYILNADDQGRNIHTKYHSTLPWGLVSNVKDNDDNWGTNHHGATAPHYFASECWDYFLNAPYGRPGINGNGGELRVQAAGTFANAYYDPVGPGKDYIAFGQNPDPYGRAIDVVAHEYMHGLTHYTADLTYSDEPGALNESFSDIFGEMVERYEQGGGSPNWIIGDDGDLPTRSLEDPESDGVHFPNPGNCITDVGQPDTYNGNNWYSGNCDNGGVHVNSGVQNFWFYLLSEGGLGTNDNGDNYNIQGIGEDAAAFIAYNALVYTLQSNAQFTDARAATITFAQNHYGMCSNEEIQTTNAWAAVGVGNTFTCPMDLGESLITKPTMYPNPAKNEVHLVFPELKDRKIRIFAVNGTLVRDMGNFKSYQIKLDIADLSKGVYILQASEGSKKVNLKLIKNQ